MHLIAGTQLTFTLGRFFGQDVTQVGLTPLKPAATGFFESLGCAAIRFHFRHYCKSPDFNSFNSMLCIVTFSEPNIPALLLWPQDHDHLATLKFRLLLHCTVGGEIRLNTLQ